MTATNQDIVSLYEQGLSIDEIACELGWEREAVKAILLVNSKLYKEQCQTQEGAEQEITDDEYKEILKAYKQLAIYSDVDSVRERALRNLINERKGRNNIQGLLKGTNFNITLINAHIKNAKEEFKRMLTLQNPPSPNNSDTVDVEVIK